MDQQQNYFLGIPCTPIPGTNNAYVFHLSRPKIAVPAKDYSGRSAVMPIPGTEGEYVFNPSRPRSILLPAEPIKKAASENLVERVLKLFRSF